MRFDSHGRRLPDTTGMNYPVACGSCGHVHDSGKVTITARYADCDMWKCPACGVTQDNRWNMFPNSPSTARKLY